MKKHLLFALSLLALAFASCGEKEGTVYKLDVDAKSMAFLATGTVAQTVTVTAENVEWTAELNDPATTWLHLEKSDGAVAVTVDDNTAATARTAKFTVKSNTAEAPDREVTVMQMGAGAADISIGVTVKFDVEFGYLGDTKPITVTAPEGVEWDVKFENQNWLTVAKNAAGFVITAAPNQEDTPREIVVAVTVDSAEEVVVTVKQAGRPHIEQNVVTIKGSYDGDMFGVGYPTYSLQIWNEFVEDIGGGWIAYGPGAVMVNLYMFGPEPDDIGSPEIPAGTYTVIDWAAAPGNNKSLSDVTISELDGIDGYFEIKPGQTFTIERSGDNYTITLDKVVLTNDIFLTSKYSGVLNVINGQYPTVLTDDVALGDFTGPGIRVYRGDQIGDGTNVWGNVICTEDVTMTPDITVGGTGYLFDFTLISEAGDGQHIPDGTYNINAAEELGNVVYCYIVELEEDFLVGESALYQGEMTISHEGDIYTIEIDGEDIAGNKVTGVWEGEYGFSNRASAPRSLNTNNYTWKAPEMAGKIVKQTRYTK